jgi:XTP/dITP diphosphohydrolase
MELTDIRFPKVVVLASRNVHKIREMSEVLNPLGLTLKSSLDYPDLADVEETSDTLEGNAYLKAFATFKHTGLPSLSDDTGLEVEALDGRPGVKSARYAGENASYSDNLQKLLTELEGVQNRSARFRTSLALVMEEGAFIFQGICDGIIREVPAGSAGFGYDPVFVPAGYQLTFAEMSEREKNSISHRGKAVDEFIRFLKNFKK